MANRYWIKGSGIWSDTSHWSATSGGVGGANVPDYSDDVFVDSNSGFGINNSIDLDTGQGMCNNFSSTAGIDYSIVNGTLEVYGSFTGERELVITTATSFLSLNETITLTQNQTKFADVYFAGSGTYLIVGDLFLTSSFTIEKGTFNANGYNVTASEFNFTSDTDYEPTIIMGSGKWTPSRSEFKITENNGTHVTISPTNYIANNNKVTTGNTWGTIDTTWATEIRTWLSVSQAFSNIARSVTNLSNSNKVISSITNISKP